MNLDVIITILIAVLGSGIFTTLLVHFLTQKQRTADLESTDATTHQTEVNTTDILTQAAERAVNMMSGQLALAQARIADLERVAKQKDVRINQLETELAETVAKLAEALMRIEHLEQTNND